MKHSRWEIGGGGGGHVGISPVRGAAAGALAGAILMLSTGGGAAQAQSSGVPSVIPFAYANSEFQTSSSDTSQQYNVLGVYNFYDGSFSKVAISTLTTDALGTVTNPTTQNFAPGTPQYGSLRVSDVGYIDGIAYNPSGLLYTVNDTVPLNGGGFGSNLIFGANLRSSTPTYGLQYKIGGLTSNDTTDSIAFLRNSTGTPLYALVDSVSGTGPTATTSSFLYTIDYNNLHLVNGALTADSTLVGQLKFNGASFLTNGTLVATPDNSLYLTQGNIPGGPNGSGGNLFKIDLSSASGGSVNVAQIGSAGFATPVFGMAAPFTHGNTNIMYAVDTAQPNANEYKVDPNTPTAIDQNTLTAKYNDPAAPPPGFGKIFGLSFTDFDAPEPSSAALVLPGALTLLGGLGMRRVVRRRRNKTV